MGGTTISQVLIDGYTKLGLKVCCDAGCDLCATHKSLDCVDRQCLGDPDHTRLVTIMREPIDRAVAYFFFQQLAKGKPSVTLDTVGTMTTEQFMRVYDPKWVRRSGRGDEGGEEGGGASKWARSEFTNRLLKRGASATVTENDVLAAADVVESSFDAVGVTAHFDALMVQIAELLGWPLQWLTYKKLKVITDRPQVADFSQALRSDLHNVLTADRVIYGRAVQTASRQQAEIDGFPAKLAAYASLQRRVDQTCQYVKHSAKKLRGSDCYDIVKT